MKKFAGILLGTVFGFAALTGSANAVSINAFDAAPPHAQNGLVSKTLQSLVTKTQTHIGTEAAKCMIKEFTVTDASTGATVPHGIGLLSAQLEVQRKAGKAGEAQVEHIVQAVYEIILQDTCAKEPTK